MTALAYRATRPDSITKFHADRLAAEKAFNEKVSEFRRTVNNRELEGIRYFDGGFAVTGFTMESRNEELPAGWRRDGASNRAVPAKRTPEGKAIAEKLKSLQLAGVAIPGVPDALDTDRDPQTGRGYRVFPGLRSAGDEHFLIMSRVPCDRDLAAIDTAEWAPVKLSEYHAALEAAGEQP